MPLNQHGQYFANPKHGEMADKMESYDKHGQKSQDGHAEENGEQKGPAEIHKLPQGYKTVTQGQDGSVEEMDHPDIHEAVHKVMSHFGEERPQASDALEPDEDDLNPDQMDAGDVNRTDSGAY